MSRELVVAAMHRIAKAAAEIDRIANEDLAPGTSQVPRSVARTAFIEVGLALTDVAKALDALTAISLRGA